MRVRHIGTITLATACLALAACGSDDDDGADAAAETTEAVAVTIAAPAATTAAEPATTMASGDAAEPGTIVDVAAGAGQFTTLLAAVEAAGLTETLAGPGPFTVFAPTDEAFAATLDAAGLTAEELLADTATLTSILTYHVIPGEVPSTDVVTLDGQSVATVNGADVAISVDGDTVKLNDATVVATDVPASNGVIHVIDSVLMPPAS